MAIFLKKNFYLCYFIKVSYLCFLISNSKIMNLDIKIKQGIGEILFDMPVETVVSLLGEPTKVETMDNAVDETTTVLQYNDELTLFFEGESPVLSCIDITNEDATLFGKEIFDLGEKEIVKLMVENNYHEQDVDNEEWGERRITFNEGNIDFYLEDDELMSIIIGK